MSDIGLARKQRVFATLETVIGTMVFPVATTDFVRPAGNAVINQTPEFRDSEELHDTLDILDRFQNAMPAGRWSIPMYLRPSGTIGVATPPQGHVLFQALMHNVEAATGKVCTTEYTASISTLNVDTIVGDFPERGVVTVAGTTTEKVYYTGITWNGRGSTSATLTGCTRGYDSTTAATHAIAQVVTLSSIFYEQDTSAPSLSIWVETDHFVQGLSGCSVDEAVFEVSNEGAVKVTFSGQGMQMVYAGSSTVSATALATNTHIHVTDAKLYKEGAYVYNYTKAGVKGCIATVDTTNNILYLENAIGACATGDVIRGYLPVGTTIGDPIEGHDTTVYIDGVSTKIKNGTLTVRAPKKFLVDEVGTTYPEEYLEDQREITMDLSLYFKKADAKYFTTGYDNDEATIRIVFGTEAGSIYELWMKKCSLQVPEVNFASPAVELRIPAKALGTDGEDSLEIIVR